MQYHQSWFSTLLIFVFILCYHLPTQAQRGKKQPPSQEIGTAYADSTIVQGIVRDAKSREPIPFADVYFVGTGIGTTTDINGIYTIGTDVYVDSIGFRFLGYQVKTMPVKAGRKQEISVQLRSVEHTTQVTVVTAKRGKKLPKDTVAIRLWRNVVQHRKDNLIEFAEDYQYGDYTKIRFDIARIGPKMAKSRFLHKKLGMVMRNIQTNKMGEPYLPLMLKETVSDVYFRKKPKAKKQVIHADRLSGVEDESVSGFVGEENEELNPFDDVIVLVGKSFVGPFSPGANNTYRYYIADTIKEGNNHFYKLEFVGRRPRDFTFLGHAIVDSTTFGIVHIEMEVPQVTNINFLKTYRLEQNYTYQDGYWVQTDGYNHSEIHVPEKPGVLFRIGIHRYTQRQDYKINQGVPDSLFNGEAYFLMDDAFRRDSTYWAEARPDTLTVLERPIYPMIDSVINSRLYKSLEWWGTFLSTGYMRFNKIEFGHFGQFVSNNTIEGWRLKVGFRTNRRMSRRFQILGFGAYGFKDREWKYGAGFNLHLNKPNRRWRTISILYKKDFELIGQQNRFMSHDNVTAAFSRREPIDRLMKIEDLGFYYTHDWFKGFYNVLSYRRKTFFSVPNVFEFSTGENLDPVESFTTSEFQLTTHWGIGEAFFTGGGGFNRSTRGTKHPVFELNYTLGLENFWDGSYTYHKLEFSMRQRLSSRIGYTWYTMKFGKFWGDAAYPLLFIHLGNESNLRNRFAFNMMNEFEFVSDSYGSIMLEHHFDGLILNNVPIIKALEWRSVFVFNGLYGELSDNNRTLINMPRSIEAPNWYGEIGFGIENIFDILRIDFLWRLTPHRTPAPYPVPRRFAVKFALEPKF